MLQNRSLLPKVEVLSHRGDKTSICCVKLLQSILNFYHHKITKKCRGGYPPPPCFGRRTISFLVNFESSILSILVAYFGHFGYCIPHLINKKADFWCKVPKKWISKTEKIRKCPKTADFGHVLVYLSN